MNREEELIRDRERANHKEDLRVMGIVPSDYGIITYPASRKVNQRKRRKLARQTGLYGE